MSAIAGVIADDGGPLDPDTPARLIAATPVRGFDGTSWCQDGPACLIRHHHATTPQAVGEIQPLPSTSGSLVMMLDGRIDNRPEIIALLARAECRDDASDAMLVLALFERFGEDCVTRLVGDWALAVWNIRDRSLFLARSPMGWRPLVWSHAGGRFAFATDARTLLRGLALDHTPNEGVVGEFLATRFLTRNETLWRSVQQLEQGAAMRIDRGILRHWHWHMIADDIDETLSDVDHIDRFQDLFSQAIVATTRSNTTVSAHLSGGLDSSSVVTRATELHRAGRIDRPVQAISARFPGLAQDETRWSSAVEDKLGITARITARVPYSFTEARRWCADTYQLPVRPNVFDTSIAAFRLMKEEGSRVLLTGEGGDEWMESGTEYFPDLLRQGRLGALVREAMSQHPKDRLWKQLARAGLWSVAPYVNARYRQRIAFPYLQDLTIPAWIQPDWAAKVGLEERLSHAAPSASFTSHVQQRRYSNFDVARRFIGFHNIVAMGERHGVEMRHPFHDLRLARFFMTAAPRMLKRDGVRKIVLREAMRGSLPEIVRTRLDKARFNDAIAEAIIQRLRERPVETLLPVTSGWLDASVVRSMADALKRPDDPRAPKNVIGAMWFIVSLDVWLSEAAG